LVSLHDAAAMPCGHDLSEMRIKIAIAAWKMWAAANKLPR
jgi:hypothetical protein